MNYNRMTIKESKVFKLKIGQSGTPTDMANCKKYFYLDTRFPPRFSGTTEECMKFIASQGAEYAEYAEI